MKILLLGGTGAMGASLAPILVSQGHEVYVTSRSHRKSENIRYIQGNAHDMAFLKEILSVRFDVIVDFMVYKTQEFAERCNLLLGSAGQYIFLSSSRVYADSEEPLREDSPRLLDICKDQEYLQTDEYALTKARQENLLRDSGKDNWTIIRPYITYSNARLQLGVYEKELWLYRALEGHTIVLPRDIASSMTTLTLGEDVARGIAAVAGNDSALGKAVHIAGARPLRWMDVLEIYQKEFREATGKEIKIQWTESSCAMREALECRYQVKYDRLFHRTFDSSMIKCLTKDELDFVPPEEGLRACLRTFLEAPSFLGISWKAQAWMDKQTGEGIRTTSFSSALDRIKYFAYRYMPGWFINCMRAIFRR